MILILIVVNSDVFFAVIVSIFVINLVIAGFESLKLIGIFIVGVVVEMNEIVVNSVINFVFFIKRDVSGIEGSEIIEIFVEVDLIG
jgi:hypothetical protein